MSNVLSGEQVISYPRYDDRHIEAYKAAWDAVAGTAGAGVGGPVVQLLGSSVVTPVASNIIGSVVGHAVGAKIGAAIGTVVCPFIGTLAGAWLGVWIARAIVE